MLAAGADPKLGKVLQPTMLTGFTKLYGPPPDFSKLPVRDAGGGFGARHAEGDEDE
jgi:hypothetical protein